MTASTATILPIILGAAFMGAGVVGLVYATVNLARLSRLSRRPTPPPLALVASRPEPEPAPTAVIPCITNAAWPASVDDTVVTFHVLPEDVTAVLPLGRGGRRAH